MSITPEQIDEMATYAKRVCAREEVDDYHHALRLEMDRLIADLRAARELLRRVDDHGMWAEISAFLRGGK